MICGRCGSSIDDNAQVCPNCGNVLAKAHADVEEIQRRVQEELREQMEKEQAEAQAVAQPEAQAAQQNAQPQATPQQQAQPQAPADNSEADTTVLAGGIFDQSVQTGEADTTVLSADALAGNVMPGEADTTVLSAEALNANIEPSEADTTLLSGSDFLRSPMGQEQMGNTVLRNENLTGPGPINGYNSVVPGKEKGPGISTGIMALLISLGAIALILIVVMVILIIKLL